MTQTLCFSVIHEGKYPLSMEMSFFAPCPLLGGLSVPRKSGHRCKADLTSILHGGWCPDLSGPAGALWRGHERKKDISMLFYMASFLGEERRRLSAKKIRGEAH